MKQKIISLIIVITLVISNIGIIFAEEYDTLDLNSTTTGFLTSSNTYHVYKIQPDKSGMLSINIESEEFMYIDFFNSNREKLFTRYITGLEGDPDIYIEDLGLNTGIYYITINSQKFNTIDTGKYTIKTSFKEVDNDDKESNDNINTANQLMFNSETTGFLAIDDREDTYVIQTNKSGYLSLDIESEVELIDINFIDKNNKKLTLSYRDWYVESEGKFKKELPLSAGEYYIQISSKDDNEYTGKYTINAAFEENNATEEEPNNDTTTANPMILNSPITGFFSIYDDEDMYKINIKKSGYVCLIVNSETEQMLINIYDENNQHIFTDLVRGTTYINDMIRLKEGTYYIKVSEPFGSRDNYTIRLDGLYFYDANSHWAKDSIYQFVSKGYVGGYSDGTFRPNNSISRSEFVTIFNKTFGLTKTSGKVFSDTKTHWAKNEIDIAVTNGVCNGKSATEFKPNDPITREEASVMIANYKKISDTNYDKINIYSDNKQISSWSKSSVEGMIEKGYMGGYSDGTFRPKGKITRAEAVVTLSRVK